MIRIEISDLANEDKVVLGNLATLFNIMATGAAVPFSVERKTTTTVGGVSLTERTEYASPPTIAPEDNPAAGAPTAQEVFKADLPASAVFGGAGVQLPNGAPSIAAVPAPVIAPGAPLASSTTSTVSPIPAPPPAPGAVTAAPMAPATQSAVRLDKTGVPYDARIHAKGENGPVMNADLTWRAKRNVSPEYKVQIENELRSLLAAPVGTVSAPPPSAPPIPMPPPSQQTTPGTVPSSVTFATVMQLLTPALASGKLSQAEVGQLLAGRGIQTLPSLTAVPHLVPDIHADLLALLAAKG